MILTAYSKALYSSWYLYAPDRLLLDCGEGVSLYLRQEIFAIEKIFLSHGHVDHIAGLLPLLCLRQSTKGDNAKPLEIYYPAPDRSIRIMKRTVHELLGNFLEYPLEWRGVAAGDRIELRKGRFMEVFPGDHPGDAPLIYVVTEQRKRLKPALQGTPGPELAKLTDEEKYDHYQAKILAYSGDSMPVDPAIYRGAEILLHECTFLRAEDRKQRVHSAIQEVFDLAQAAGVKRLILTHISPRYFRKEIAELIAKADSRGVPFDYVVPERLNEF